MNLATKLKNIFILTGIAALTVTSCAPKVLSSRDLTGDGRPDQVLQANGFNNYLLVGQADGLSLSCGANQGITGVSAFDCPNGVKYVWSPQYGQFVEAGQYKP